MADIPCVVTIRRNADGVTRSYDDEWFDASEFCWDEGNFACDCNREIFFERAAGKEIDNERCGEGRFSVHIETKGGVVLYDDMDADPR